MIELRPWESQPFTRHGNELTETAMPGRHAPEPLQRFLPPVMGSLLQFGASDGGHPFRIYITGDTLVHDRLHEIPKHYPDIDLCLIHLGGTRVAGVLLTMDAHRCRAQPVTPGEA